MLNASSHPRCLFPSLPLRLSFHLRREPSDSQQQRPSTLRFWAGHPLAECGSAGLCTGSAHEATAEAESIDRRLLAHACLYYHSITRGSSPVFFTPNISGFDFPSRTSRILLGTPVTRATRRRNPESIKIYSAREKRCARLSMCRWSFFFFDVWLRTSCEGGTGTGVLGRILFFVRTFLFAFAILGKDFGRELSTLHARTMPPFHRVD